MSNVLRRRVPSSALLLLTVAGLASTTVACSKQEESKKTTGWTCNASDVPMGEVLRCTQQAATADGPVGGSTSDGTTTTGGAGGTAPSDPVTTDGTSGAGTTDGSGATGGLDDSSLSSDGTITYECFADDTNPDCPPADAYDGMTGGSGGSDSSGPVSSDSTTGTGDGTGGAGGGSTSNGTSDGTSGAGTGGGNGNGGGAGGASNGSSQGTSDGTSSNGNGNGNGGASGNGGSNKFPGPDECAWVPDLPYCPAGSGATSDGTTSNGNGNGAAGSDKPLPPGQEKKYGGTSDGTSSAGSSSGGASSSGGNGSNSGTTDGSGSTGSGKGKGRHYQCEKDGKGNKTCTSVPNCVPGTTPSNGACADGDSGSGSSGEVLPPALGGCWITGGGFIIAPNDLTGAPADGHDNYGGNAKPMKDGRIQGHWNHVDHGTGNHAKGKPEYIVCRHVDEPGPGQPGGKKGFTANQAYFGGPAEWRDASTGVWESGYWFDVVVKDHGEPGSVPHAKNGYMVDTYHFTIRKMDDPVNKVSGAVIYEVGRGGNQASGGIVGGNIQLHPPNNGHPYTPMSLPSWVSFEP